MVIIVYTESDGQQEEYTTMIGAAPLLARELHM
jgi:hypothetical protein